MATTAHITPTYHVCVGNSSVYSDTNHDRAYWFGLACFARLVTKGEAWQTRVVLFGKSYTRSIQQDILAVSGVGAGVLEDVERKAQAIAAHYGLRR